MNYKFLFKAFLLFLLIAVLIFVLTLFQYDISSTRNFISHAIVRYKEEEQVAQKLYHKVRILCLVLTFRKNHRTKADHVLATWGRRCNKLLFVTAEDDHILPTLKLPIQEGRLHLTAKVIQAFDFVFKYHMDDADWFLKGDDDAYFIMENLRFMLSQYNSSDPLIFGQYFKSHLGKNDSFFSGGAGYVISKDALRRFGQRSDSQCDSDGGNEDVKFSRCMRTLGVKSGDSRDSMGRSRFHCFQPEVFMGGNYPKFYILREYFGAKPGMDSMSNYPISFHHLSNVSLYVLEYFIYHVKLHGYDVHNNESIRWFQFPEGKSTASN